MSNDAPRLTKKDKKAPAVARAEAQAEAAGGGGVLGYVVGGALGLAILFLIWRGTTGTTQANERPELPHIAIMAEFTNLGDPVTRTALADLQRDLVELKEEVFGPLNAPIILRGADGKPVAKDIDKLSEAEFAKAASTFAAGGWLVPRIYRGDLMAAVIRVGPAGSHRFPAGTRDKVQAILDKYKGSGLTLSAYSHDLRLNDQGAREKINLSFGVQTANAIAFAANDKLFKGDGGASLVMDLYKRTKALADSSRIRSITSQGSFWIYAMSAARGEVARDDVAISPEDEARLTELAKQANIPVLVDREGRRAMVFVTTDAEGKENLNTCYYVAANAGGKGIVLRVDR